MSEWPWLRALAWLAFLGPFFFLTYNFSNAMSGQRASVVMFSWERYIPFVAWTILPYWSSDLLYAVSLGVCRTKEELDLHGKRLVAIQVFSVACFLLFPLRCVMERPAVGGWAGSLFNSLASFDLPFNQAPSLHVSLAVILWMRFRSHAGSLARVFIAAYLVLVGGSSLTTYQHQFIDVPTGLWAGLLVIAALPERRLRDPEIRLTAFYMAGALACTAAAFAIQGISWLLLWPGFALSMVACAYWTGDAAWLLKGPAGLFMLPYTVAAWINSRWWTRGEAVKNHLTDSVWIGRASLRAEGVNSVVALAPELRMRADAHVAMLDLMPPTEEQLEAAVRAIDKLEGQRPTLVCCALGYSRSALASAAWLIAAGHAADSTEALAQVRRARPQVIVGPAFEQRLKEWAERRGVHAG